MSYTVKVKLYLGALSGELAAELPVILMHPKVRIRFLLIISKFIFERRKKKAILEFASRYKE